MAGGEASTAENSYTRIFPCRKSVFPVHCPEGIRGSPTQMSFRRPRIDFTVDLVNNPSRSLRNMSTSGSSGISIDRGPSGRTFSGNGLRQMSGRAGLGHASLLTVGEWAIAPWIMRGSLSAGRAGFRSRKGSLFFPPSIIHAHRVERKAEVLPHSRRSTGRFPDGQVSIRNERAGTNGFQGPSRPWRQPGSRYRRL